MATVDPVLRRDPPLEPFWGSVGAAGRAVEPLVAGEGIIRDYWLERSLISHLQSLIQLRTDIALT